MSVARRLLPHPITSVLLALLWPLLQQSMSVGNVLLGLAFGVLIPLFTRRFWPEHVQVSHPLTLLRFLVLVMWDILAANFSVARLALGPLSAIQPGFARLPLELENDFAITILASTVSLTPGTVSAELSADRSHLVVHYLVCDDEAELLRSIKQRYETPLREIFEC